MSLSLSCKSPRIRSKLVAVFFPRLALPLLASHAVIVLSTLCDRSVASITNCSRRLSCMKVPFCEVLSVEWFEFGADFGVGAGFLRPWGWPCYNFSCWVFVFFVVSHPRIEFLEVEFLHLSLIARDFIFMCGLICSAAAGLLRYGGLFRLHLFLLLVKPCDITRLLYDVT